MTTVALRPAHPAEADVLARLMTDAISWGRLGELGPRFVGLLHQHMIGTRHGICIVAEVDGAVVGYIAAATDVRRFYREFLLTHGVRAAWTLLPSIWRPKRLATILRGSTHMTGAPEDDPPAEMLSFAVQPGLGTRGIGTRLFDAAIDALRARQVRAVKFGTVDVNNEVGNTFYQKRGCTLVRTVPFHRDSAVNVYVYDIDGTA